MPTPNKPQYTHGSSGTAPPSPIDYVNGDAVDPDHFDYYIHTNFWYIKNLIDAIRAIDSDDDGQVDAADVADEAGNAKNSYKGNDIDSDGDGVVDKTDEAGATNGVFKTAGSLPQYQTESDGLSDTNIGDAFYDAGTNTVVVNRGQ